MSFKKNSTLSHDFDFCFKSRASFHVILLTVRNQPQFVANDGQSENTFYFYLSKTKEILTVQKLSDWALKKDATLTSNSHIQQVSASFPPWPYWLIDSVAFKTDDFFLFFFALTLRDNYLLLWLKYVMREHFHFGQKKNQVTINSNSN